jgi:hypothetical protein
LVSLARSHWERKEPDRADLKVRGARGIAVEDEAQRRKQRKMRREAIIKSGQTGPGGEERTGVYDGSTR